MWEWNHTSARGCRSNIIAAWSAHDIIEKRKGNLPPRDVAKGIIAKYFAIIIVLLVTCNRTANMNW